MQLQSHERFLALNVLDMTGSILGQVVPLLCAIFISPTLNVVVPATFVTSAIAVGMTFWFVAKTDTIIGFQLSAWQRLKELFHFWCVGHRYQSGESYHDVIGSASRRIDAGCSGSRTICSANELSNSQPSNSRIIGNCAFPPLFRRIRLRRRNSEKERRCRLAIYMELYARPRLL